MADTLRLLARERDMRGPGCDERCAVVKAVLVGGLGRSELLLHEPAAHEAFGHAQALSGLDPAGLVFRSGPLEIDFAAMRLTVRGREVRMSDLEWRLLRLLTRRPGAALEGDDLLAGMYGRAYLETGRTPARRALVQVVWRLRGKLEDVAGLIERTGMSGLRLAVRPVSDEAVPFFHDRMTRWALAWDACRRCGRTSLRHGGHGYCTTCHKGLRMKGEL